MNIKEVEQLVEIKKANIRYYEQEGLLTPKRNADNNYREYSMEDVEELKKIKFLRMVGIPVQDILELKKGRTTIPVLMQLRKEEIAREMKQLEDMNSFCRELAEHASSFDSLDISHLDLRNEFFLMKGEKIMRLDKIYNLEKYEKLFDWTWKVIFMIYWPLNWALKLVYHYELPDTIQILFVISVVSSAIASLIFRYRIAYHMGRKE